MNYTYVSIDRIFSKLVRDVTDEFSESDVVEWCGEALEFTGATKLYEEAVTFIEVKNHQCDMPKGTHAIIQIARDNRWNGPRESDICPKAIVDSICEIKKDKTAIPVRIDCEGQPVDAYDLAYYRPFFDLKSEFLDWRHSTYYARYTPVRLATSKLYDSLVCKENEDVHYGDDNYTVIRGQKLRFSFREGFIAIATLRTVLDEETGYPMVPDNISYTTAIVKYITMKLLDRQCYNGREGTCGKAKDAMLDWHWYCKQASNVDIMPNGVDEYQNLLNQRSYILPRQNKYYNFFGSLSKAEGRPWNDPNQRNKFSTHLIGN
jgi:hypothetical protein